MIKLPIVDPNIDSLTAIAIAFAITDYFTPVEQNALGNWFILIGQVLETNAGFGQVNEQANSKPNFSKDDFNKIIDILNNLKRE